MKQKLIFLILVFVLLGLPLVYSVPPFVGKITSINQANGLTVKPLPFETVIANTDLNFHTHVFNNSNGKPMTDGIVCYLHLYNLTQEHIAIVLQDTISHDFDYELVIGGNNFTDGGIYSYILQCNNSVVGGFTSGEIISTLTGEVPRTGTETWLLLLPLLPLIIAFFFLYISNNLKIIEEDEPLRLFLQFLGMLMVFPMFGAVYWLSSINPEYFGLTTILNINVYGWIYWTLFAIYLLWTIKKGTDMMNNAKGKLPKIGKL